MTKKNLVQWINTDKRGNEMEKLAAEYMEVVYEEKRIAERKEELKSEMVKLIGEDEAKIESVS